MKRYLCVQCDEPFESDEAKPRCPKCMRVGGIHALDGDGKPAGKADSASAAGGDAGRAGNAAAARVTPLGATLGVLGLLAIVGGVLWSRETPGGGEAIPSNAPRNAAAGQLSAALLSDPLAKMLHPGDAVTAFAEKAAGDVSGADDKARRVFEAIRARASATAFIPWSLSEPRPTGPMVAEQVMDKLAADGGRAQLYPLEVAAVAVAALRSLEVDAQIVEIFAFEGERSPPDPSGRFGYYGAWVGPAQGGKLLDPYGAHAAKVAEADRTLLSDAEAVAAALALRSVHLGQPSGDVARALEAAKSALTVYPSSPTVRTANAFALLVSAAAMPGVRELESALQQRDDAPRHLNMAFARMAGGELSGASKHLAKALELRPDYALAHLNLSRLHLAQGERTLARGALERAEQLDPQLPVLSLAWAGLHLVNNELDLARARAERAVQDRPDSAEARLTLARVQRQAGQYDAMRREAHTLMEMVSGAQRDRTRQLILATLGPTALEPLEEEEGVAEGTAPDAGAGPELPDPVAPALDVTAGSRLLGDDDDDGEPRFKLKQDDLKLNLDL